MHAIVIDKFKEAGSVRELPEPSLEPHTVLVRTTFAGVNPVDWKIREGQSGKRQFPLVLGQDFAGVVESVGAGVSRVKAGDRVFGCAREHGSYSEETLVPDDDHTSPLARIPSGLDDAVAAALPTPGLTALAALDILGVASGTELLIVGAAGAVGAGAVQIARNRGAKVTAVVRPGQAGEVRALGAREAVEVTDDAVEPVRKAHAAPFAAVLDLVSSADVLKKNLPLYAKGGKVVTTIHVADEAWFREHEIEAVNMNMAVTDTSSAESLTALAEMVVAGKLRVDIAAERPLREAAVVLDELKSGKSHGKIVLRVKDTTGHG
jgi:NADPH:quinone reductase-like Zn-dependent oxidoreductase